MRYIGHILMPSAKLAVTRTDLDLLFSCAEQHYDFGCRALGVPGPGAVLCAWRFRMGEGTETEVEVTTRQLDRLLKLTETPYPYPGFEAVVDLHWAFRRIAIGTRDLYVEGAAETDLAAPPAPVTEPRL